MLPDSVEYSNVFTPDFRKCSATLNFKSTGEAVDVEVEK